MIGKHESINPWLLSMEWILASLVGWVAGLVVGVALTFAGGRLGWVNEDRFLVYAVLVSVGLCVGVAQSRVMRRVLPRPGRWVGATLLGYLLALLIAVVFSYASLMGEGLQDDVLLLFLIGAAIGLPQWWLLRRHFQGAAVWVAASAAGFLCFLWLVANPAGSQGSLVLMGAILGALAAAVTGVALVWLARDHAVDAQTV